MITAMHSRIVLDDKVWTAILTAMLSYAAVLVLYLGTALFIGVPTWMSVATWIGLAVMIALHGKAPWRAFLAVARAVLVRRALARPDAHATLHTIARKVALDYVNGFPEDALQGPTVSATTEWVCMHDGVYPMATWLEERGRDGQRLPNGFTHNQRLPSYSLHWSDLNVHTSGHKPFALFTTVGPFPAGSAHARLQRMHETME